MVNLLWSGFRGFALVCVAALLCVFSQPAMAQTAGSGSVVGTVTDATGAAVAGATVTLTDASTNQPRTTVSNETGRYAFPNVDPGTYNLTINKAGFRVAAFSKQSVTVGTTLTLNASLEVGSVTQTVEVTSTNAELQTSNATVGNTISGAELESMPSINRDANTFVTLQPGVAPDGSVAGAAMDQSSFSLDGGQNTSDMDGGMTTYTPSFAGDVTGGVAGGGPTGVIPAPIDSIEEFKVNTTNQTADFNSSAGAEVSMVTKRGGNSWHGTGYLYYLDNKWSANSFENNISGTPVPSYHYNRFGFAGGGPLISKKILGGKTYFFANYEGFRFPNSQTINRDVPTASMRLGLLYFAGTYYNLNPTAVTYNSTVYPGTSLDPRGIGVNATVLQMWSKEPLPNTTACNGLSLCDVTSGGGNVGVFTGNMALAESSNFGVARLDHDFSDKWHFMGSYHYYKLIRATSSQFTIANGAAVSTSSRPQVPDLLVAGVTTNVSTNTTNDVHFSYLRNFWQWGSAGDPPQLPTLGGALDPFGQSENQQLSPLNVDTQNTRQRFWDGHDTTIRDDVSILHGSHFFTFGGTYERDWEYHERSDNGGGINYQPVYELGVASGPGIDMNNLPAGLPAASNTNYGRDYAAALGIVSISQTAYTRSGATLTLNPPLTPAQDKSTIPFYNVYFSDSWHMKPSFTLTYGLGWTLEMPPVEEQGRQVELVDTAGQQISTEAYLNARKAAALQGQVYNPELGFALVGNTGGGQKYPYNPFYGSFSPRLAAAWNPSFDSGLLGKAFGEGKTVVRGGYSRIFGRLNGVDLVLVPLLGTGLIQPVQCFNPLDPAAAAMNNVTCAGSKVATPSNAFRIGTDGLTAPLPAPSATLPQPVFPGYNAIASGAGEALDLNFRPNESDQFDLTIQRQLSNRVSLEVGYIGRRITHEYQPININAVPYMMTQGGQTFAKAYSNVEVAYCGGGTTAGLAGAGCVANAAAVQPQPFFEAALAGTGYCTGFANCTQAVVANEGAAGTGNLTTQSVWNLWSDLDNGGFNFPRTMMNTPIAGQAFGADGQLTSGVGVNASLGWGNYNALFTTVKMAAWHGVTLQSNFTWGKALGTTAEIQATSEFTTVDPYNIGNDYGPQPFDRKFVYNMLMVYEPPFYTGQHGAIGRLLGGWSFSPIFTTASGLPLEINTTNGDSQAFGAGDSTNFFNDENGVLTCANNFGSSRHNNVSGSGGIATNGNVNMFANPVAVWGCLRNPILGLDTGHNGGQGNAFRGMPFWNVDFQVRKNVHITERLSAEFQSIFSNVFNHDQLADPVLDLSNPAGFGVESSQANTPRSIEVGVRLRF